MNTVLLQEILRYNTLLEVIKTTLSTLIQACDGVVVMTNELEHMGYQVRINQIPDIWRKKSYPCLKPLNSYIKDLLLRIDMFRKWSTDKAPNMFWVPGFFFT